MGAGRCKEGPRGAVREAGAWQPRGVKRALSEGTEDSEGKGAAWRAVDRAGVVVSWRGVR